MINSNWGNSIAFSLKKYVYECLTEYNVQPKATFQQAGLERRSTSVRRFHSQCSLPDRPYTRLYPFMDTDLSYTEYQELSRRYHHFLGRNGNFRRAGARIVRTIPDSGCVPYGIALSPSEHKPRVRGSASLLIGIFFASMTSIIFRLVRIPSPVLAYLEKMM